MPSPNPRGRPKGPHTLAAALRDAFPIEKLVEIANEMLMSSSEDVRMKAWLTIMERAHGKVADKLELGPPGSIDAEDVRADSYTLEELREMEAIEARRAARLAIENRDQNPKVLDGGLKLLPIAVAHAAASIDED